MISLYWRRQIPSSKLDTGEQSTRRETRRETGLETSRESIDRRVEDTDGVRRRYTIGRRCRTRIHDRTTGTEAAHGNRRETRRETGLVTSREDIVTRAEDTSLGGRDQRTVDRYLRSNL
jgi:hypothetical protein